MYGNLHYGVEYLRISLVNIRIKMRIPAAKAKYLFDQGKIMVEQDVL